MSEVLRVYGFTALRDKDKFPRLWKDIRPLAAARELLKQKETVIEGLENVPKSFEEYMSGNNHDRVIIQVVSLDDE
ncbi:hypothetical protein BGZ80_006458 [Entomortierella chlamydospora]|uniref:Alcohol dehydrogenase n=1 Tax=Entomortierella chlamydospora TaxID=101097 RepID=A0A9P6T1U0_9FUNG|nr:hypothetical protein BGZ80_006458 [Entomortierella chlamydospora]